MTVVTRFAPSPTGFLHIGGARTALFNWLYARHEGGQFRLRIEDTDRARSTPEATQAILDGLRWLGLDWDGEVVYQSQRAERHAEVARALLAAGHAYYCYATQEELTAMREAQKAAGQPTRYDGRWRDRDPSEAPEGVPPVVRLKAPQEGETVLADGVQGEIRVANTQLDDMILLRADGTPTYMLSVVVDDHDMGITQVLRGDDHLTNTFRQVQLYNALGWAPPRFAHISLIHGPDGAKMSKRHGAIGLEAYRDKGYLPEAMRNYLLRLGWGHGDDEIISTEQAIAWFDLDGIGRSAARFDQAKLDSLNAHYLRETEDGRLVDLIWPILETALEGRIVPEGRDRLLAALPDLKPRNRNLIELAEASLFLVRERPLPLNAKAEKLLSPEARQRLGAVRAQLAALEGWDMAAIEACVKAYAEGAYAEGEALKLGAIAQPLRAALTGSNVSPGIFEVATILGREETLARLDEVLARTAAD